MTNRHACAEHRHRRSSTALVVCCLLAGSLVVLAACSSTSSGSAGPRLVTPKALGGSSGIGPRVITAAPAASDLGTAGQPVDLSDRRLTVDAVTTPSSGDPGATVVEVKVVITNTGDAAIQNQSAFFQLMGVGGDAFGSRNAGPDPFYDPIDARASRSGSVIFEIPTAAVSNLHLLYRPEVPSDAVVVPLGSR